WAKFDRQTEHWHPLLCHALDVGATTLALWDEVLTPTLRERLAADLGLSVDAARAWIAFFAACHDVGKLSPSFQRLRPEWLARLSAAGFAFHSTASTARHGTISTIFLNRCLVTHFGLSRPLANRLATLIG